MLRLPKGLTTRLILVLTAIMIFLVGIMAALASFCIEFSVFRSLFPSIQIGDQTLNNSIFLPLILVAVLEVAKLGVHLWHTRFAENPVTKNKKITFILNGIKWGLILFSFFCSLIFVSSNLNQYGASYKMTAITDQRNAIIAEYNIGVDNIKAEADQLINFDIGETQQSLLNAEIKLRQLQDDYGKNTKKITTQKLQTLIDSQKIDIDKLKVQLADLKASSQEKRYQERDENLVQLENDLNKSLDSLKNNHQILSAGDNFIIRSFLEQMAELRGKEGYSRPAYFAFIALFSLAISFFYEMIIFASQYFVGMTDEEKEIFFGKDVIMTPEVNKQVLYSITLICCVLVAFSIFILFGLIQELSFGKSDIASALAAFTFSFAAVSIFKIFQKNYKTPLGVDNSSQIASHIRSLLLNATLSVAGYAVIGLMLGHAAEGVTLSSIGIGLGSIGGELIRGTYLS